MSNKQQCRFIENKSRQTNLITSSDWIHKISAMNVVCLDFSKAFDTLPRKTLREKWTSVGLKWMQPPGLEKKPTNQPTNMKDEK